MMPTRSDVSAGQQRPKRPTQSRMPLRGTSKDENRGRSPVEPGNVTGAVSPSFSLAPGPLGTNNCRREHECQSLDTQRPHGRPPWFKSQGGLRDGRAGGSVRGAGRAQGHRDGGGAPPDDGVKLDSVASAVVGKSARAMLEALIAGDRDPAVLADFAQTRMRVKIPELRLALEGGLSARHALLRSGEGRG